MTDAQKMLVFRLRHKGKAVKAIARQLGVFPNSVRYLLNQQVYLGKARMKRREQGKKVHRCSICGDVGHNRTTHGLGERE